MRWHTGVGEPLTCKIVCSVYNPLSVAACWLCLRPSSAPSSPSSRTRTPRTQNDRSAWFEIQQDNIFSALGIHAALGEVSSSDPSATHEATSRYDPGARRDDDACRAGDAVSAGLSLKLSEALELIRDNGVGGRVVRGRNQMGDRRSRRSGDVTYVAGRHAHRRTVRVPVASSVGVDGSIAGPARQALAESIFISKAGLDTQAVLPWLNRYGNPSEMTLFEHDGFRTPDGVDDRSLWCCHALQLSLKPALASAKRTGMFLYRGETLGEAEEARLSLEPPDLLDERTYGSAAAAEYFAAVDAVMSRSLRAPVRWDSGWDSIGYRSSFDNGDQEAFFWRDSAKLRRFLTKRLRVNTGLAEAIRRRHEILFRSGVFPFSVGRDPGQEEALMRFRNAFVCIPASMDDRVRAALGIPAPGLRG